MFGINGGELLILLLVVAVVVGPERLPQFAEQLATWVRRLRDLARDTRDRVGSELGEDELDWAALDPRRYDPRRIVRDALLEDVTPRQPTRPAGHRPVRTAAAAASAAAPTPTGAGGPAPFDDEAT